MLTTRIDTTGEKGIYLWIAHLLNHKPTEFGGYIMNIDFCRKNGRCETYHFKVLHTLRAVNTKLKSHNFKKTTALRRQMIVQYENKIKCSKSTLRNYIICAFSDMTLHLLDLMKSGN